MLKKIYFSCQINLTTGKRLKNKNIESLKLTKVNLLRLKLGIYYNRLIDTVNITTINSFSRLF